MVDVLPALCFFLLGFVVSGVIFLLLRAAHLRLHSPLGLDSAFFNLFGQVLDSTALIFFLKDTQGRYLLVNRQFALLLGFAHWRDLLGKSDSDLVDAELAKVFNEEDNEVLRTAQPLNGKVHRYRGIAGDSRLEQTFKYPLLSPRGEALGILGLCVDITERETLKRRLQAASARELGPNFSFLSGVHRSLRSPLNAVLGMTGLLARTSLSRQQTEYVDSLAEAADELRRAVLRTLELADLDAGLPYPEPVPFDLRFSLTRQTETFVTQCRKHGLDFELSIDPALPDRVLGNEEVLASILEDLVANAAEAGGSDAVVLEVRGRGENRYRFRVKDSGRGLTPQDIGSYFGPEPSRPRRPTRGSELSGGLSAAVRAGSVRHVGIGLELCRRRIARLGGILSAESTPGTGTAVHFDLDLPTPADIASESEEGISDLLPLRILLVDDAAVNRSLLGEVLRAEGVEVREAENGKQALSLLARSEEEDWTTDAVLMDLAMPEMDGFEAARRIHDGEAGPQPPLIAVSAEPRGVVSRAVRAAGFAGFLSKPVEPRELFGIIRRVLSGTPSSVGEPSAAPAGGGANGANPSREGLESLPELPGFDFEAGLRRVRGNGRLYRRLLQSYCEDYRSVTEDLRELGSLEDRIRFAHTLKGVASNLGALGTAEVAGKLTELLRGGMESDSASALAHLRESLAEEVRAIGDWLAAEEESPRNTQKFETILSGANALTIQALEGFLIQNDSRAGRLAAVLAQDLADSPWADLVGQVRAACEEFDYEEALVLLRSLV